MPFEMHVDPSDGLMVITVTGAPGLEDHLAFAERLARDPEYRRRPRLWDYRPCRSALSGREIRLHAARVRRLLGDEPSRAAFLVDSDVQFGVQRMFQGFRGYDVPGFERRVFREEAEARRWLRSGTTVPTTSRAEMPETVGKAVGR
jgi:hypothetical protein